MNKLFILLAIIICFSCKKNEGQPIHAVKFVTDANNSKQLIIDGVSKYDLTGTVESGQIITAKASSGTNDTLNAVLYIDGAIISQHHGLGTFSINYTFK